MSEDTVMNSLKRVKDKIFDSKRLVVALAILGCMSSTPAKAQMYGNSQVRTEQVKNNVGEFAGVIKDIDQDFVILLTNQGEMKIQSQSLVQAVTRAHNKHGGNLVIKGTFNRNTSQVTGGTVYHSPVRETDARWDIGNITDGINEVVGNARDLNIERVLENIGNAVEQYSPDHFQGGTVRVKGVAEDGKVYWVEFHKVENGQVKPEYYKNKTRRSTSNSGYSQSSYSSSAGNNGYSQSSYSSSAGNNSYSQTTTAGQGYFSKYRVIE